MKLPQTQKTIKRRRIVFAFRDDRAHEVAVTGDFNQWNCTSHPMKHDGNGIWQKIMLLPPANMNTSLSLTGSGARTPTTPTSAPTVSERLTMFCKWLTIYREVSPWHPTLPFIIVAASAICT